MKYFKKIGRVTIEEQSVIQRIDLFIDQKQIPLEFIPECANLDDLLEVLELVNSYEIQLDAKEDIESVQSSDQIQDAVELDHRIDEVPESIEEVLQEETIDDSQELIEEVSEDQDVQSNDLDEIGVKSEQGSAPDFIGDNYDPFADEIIERSYNVSGSGGNDQQKVTPLDDSDEIELEESSSTPVDKLNPQTKKRAAEQTADAILKGYARVAPMPFKWLAKVNEQKVEELTMSGQIDITIEVEEGTTFEDYMKQTNEQVDEVFKVEQDTLDEIREPLVEVLMEQEMELTPQQRLMMAVVSHLFQMLTVALKLRGQNNRILQYQKHISQMKQAG